MKIRILIGLLAGLILASLLMVGIGSTSTGCPPGEYCVWCDMDDDGDVDIFDIVFISAKYGTSGNPQRNVTFVDPIDVNVTNWPEYLLPGPSSGIEAVKITAMEWSERTYGTYGGACVIEGVRNLTLPFVFNPKGTNFNVTDMWVTCQCALKTVGPTAFSYWITLNNVDTYPAGPVSTASITDNSFLYTVTTHAVNPTTITRGINILDAHSPSAGNSHLYFLRVEIFIEYEYSA